MKKYIFLTILLLLASGFVNYTLIVSFYLIFSLWMFYVASESLTEDVEGVWTKSDKPIYKVYVGLIYCFFIFPVALSTNLSLSFDFTPDSGWFEPYLGLLMLLFFATFGFIEKVRKKYIEKCKELKNLELQTVDAIANYKTLEIETGNSYCFTMESPLCNFYKWDNNKKKNAIQQLRKLKEDNYKKYEEWVNYRDSRNDAQLSVPVAVEYFLASEILLKKYHND